MLRKDSLTQLCELFIQSECDRVFLRSCVYVCVCLCVTPRCVVCHSGPLLSTAGVSQNPIRSKSHLGGTFIMGPAHSDCCYEYN